MNENIISFGFFLLSSSLEQDSAGENKDVLFWCYFGRLTKMFALLSDKQNRIDGVHKA